MAQPKFSINHMIRFAEANRRHTVVVDGVPLVCSLRTTLKTVRPQFTYGTKRISRARAEELANGGPQTANEN